MSAEPVATDQAEQHPLLFPFVLDAISKANPRLQTMRHGHTEELVMLREN